MYPTFRTAMQYNPDSLRKQQYWLWSLVLSEALPQFQRSGRSARFSLGQQWVLWKRWAAAGRSRQRSFHSSAITFGFDSLGKWPWRKSDGDGMKVGYGWESPISFSWQDSCAKDIWSFSSKMAPKAPTKWHQWNSVNLKGWIFFFSLALLKRLPLLHWKWSEQSSHFTPHL